MPKGGVFQMMQDMKKQYLELGIEALPSYMRRPRAIQKMLATPPWSDPQAIRNIEMEAYMRSKQTGVKYVVDHIVPLQNRIVNGLHVPGNLQIITHEENDRKGNYWWPDMPDRK